MGGGFLCLWSMRDWQHKRRQGVMMEAKTSQTFEYRGHNIVVTQAPPFWEAAIYPSDPSLPVVDWTSAPIRAVNEKVAEGESQRRIDEALGVTLE
jgi:hypothetical protein